MISKDTVAVPPALTNMVVAASAAPFSHSVAAKISLAPDVLVTSALTVTVSPSPASAGVISRLLTSKTGAGIVSEPDMAKVEKRVMVTV